MAAMLLEIVKIAAVFTLPIIAACLAERLMIHQRFTFRNITDNEEKLVVVTDTLTGKSMEFRQCGEEELIGRWMAKQVEASRPVAVVKGEAA